MEGPETKLEECRNFLQKAKNDNERLAALMAVPKLLDSECSIESLCPSISTDFINRLLDSQSIDYITVSVNVLSTFLRDSENSREHFLPCLSHLIDATYRCLDENLGDEQTSEHCFGCMIQFLDCQNVDWRNIEPKCERVILLAATKQMGFLHAFDLNTDCLTKLNNKTTILDNLFSKDLFKMAQKEKKLIQVVQKADILLSTIILNNVEFSGSLPSWAENLRIGLRTLLQLPLQPEHKQLVLRCCGCALEIFHWKWIAGEPLFIVLLASLAAVEIRILLENDSENLLSKNDEKVTYVRCCDIIEKAMAMGEGIFEPEFSIDDQNASKISICCQEIVTYFLQYLVKCKELGIELGENVLLPMERIITAFRAIGGDEILDPKILSEAKSSLTDLEKLKCR